MDALERPRRKGWHWRDDARCAGMETDLFFPGRFEPATEALAACRRCAVQTACLEDDLAAWWPHGTPVGIRGGMTAHERSALRAKRNKATHSTGKPYDWTGATTRSQPHGSNAGYMRHRRSGETPCEACVVANRQYQTDAKARRRMEVAS